MVAMQRHIIGITFALQIVLALSCCRIESEKEYPTVSKILQADNFNRLCEIVGIDRMSAHRDMPMETYEQNSFSGTVDGLSVDVSIVEEDGKLVLLRVKIETKVVDKEVFVNDILKNVETNKSIIVDEINVNRIRESARTLKRSYGYIYQGHFLDAWYEKMNDKKSELLRLDSRFSQLVLEFGR